MEGVSRLTRQYLPAAQRRPEAGGSSRAAEAPQAATFGGGVETRCVGYVRNIVPEPDEGYRLPVPLAHVPVFTPRDPALAPAEGAGTWIAAAEAPALLAERHWWPIAQETFGLPGATAAR
ncbi:hypothetical protein ACFY36_43175 [Actinoplanes sp. NPDC000266]